MKDRCCQSLSDTGEPSLSEESNYPLAQLAVHPERKIFSQELLVKHHQTVKGHREGFLRAGNLALVHTGCWGSQNADLCLLLSR